MNNFTSTCNQPVTSATCSGALNPVTYIDSLCFVRVNKKYLIYLLFTS